MKYASIINSLILIGMLLGNNCFASEAPKGWLERIKQSIGFKQEQKPEEIISKYLFELYYYVEPEKSIIQSIKSDLVPILTIGGITGGSLVGYTMGKGLVEKQFEAALVLGSIGTITGIATAVATNIIFYLAAQIKPYLKKRNKITREQAVNAQKIVYSTLLNATDAFPTEQMKLNEVIRLIVQLSKEDTDKAELQVDALKLLKKDLENSPIIKKIKFLQKDYPVGTPPETLLKLQKYGFRGGLVPITDIGKLVIGEMIINEYIHRLSSSFLRDQKTFQESPLWDTLKQELTLLADPVVKNPTGQETEFYNIMKKLNAIRSYEYKAFKSILKAFNPNSSLPVIWYEHEYEKVKNNLEDIEQWLNDLKKEPFYDIEVLNTAIENVNAREKVREKPQVEKVDRNKKWKQYKFNTRWSKNKFFFLPKKKQPKLPRK